jgi:hypothetical protein
VCEGWRQQVEDVLFSSQLAGISHTPHTTP